MDAEGYPEDHELEQIRTWDYNDFAGLIDFIEARWAYKWFEREVGKDAFGKSPVLMWSLSTAGWSGNEDIIHALLANDFFRQLWYYSWRTGGHYVFRINPENAGYKLVSDYCKENDITRQAIYKSIDKYKVFRMSKNKVFVKKLQ